MTSSRVLFWHRRDLRLADNLGLVAAAQISPAVTGVYVLDPQVINPPEHLPPMAPSRLWFLVESLVELQQRWREAGSRLVVLEGDPVAVLPQLAQQIGAEAAQPAQPGQVSPSRFPGQGFEQLDLPQAGQRCWT